MIQPAWPNIQAGHRVPPNVDNSVQAWAMNRKSGGWSAPSAEARLIARRDEQGHPGHDRQHLPRASRRYRPATDEMLPIQRFSDGSSRSVSDGIIGRLFIQWAYPMKISVTPIV